jgi:chromate reductase
VPEGVTRLRDAIAAHDALVIVTPEYNGFPTPLFINAFDWLSRLPDGVKTTADKPAALLASSPGALGGMRAMNFLRQYLQMAFAMLVVPQQQAIGRAGEAFAADGTMADPKAAATLAGVVGAVLKLAASQRA